MPIGRILLKSISESKKLSQLKTDGARLLYTWLIPHLDINGCFSGDAEVINGMVLTRLKKPVKIVEEYLQDLSNNNLIIRYEVNGDIFLQVPDFKEKQPSLRPEKEKQPTIPLPPPNCLESLVVGNFPGENGEFLELPAQDKISKDKLKIREVKDNISKDKETLASPLALLLDRDKEFKDCFDKARNYFPDIGAWFGKSFKQYGKDTIEQNRDELLLTMQAIIAKETFDGEPWGYATKTFLGIVRDKSIREQNKEKQGRMSHVRDILPGR